MTNNMIDGQMELRFNTWVNMWPRCYRANRYASASWWFTQMHAAGHKFTICFPHLCKPR